jgi:hypothetical protein
MERCTMNEREARNARFRAEQDQLEAALDDACGREDDEAAIDAFREAAQHDHFILCLDSCPRDGCETGELNLGWPLNYLYPRVRYGDERGHLQRVADHAAQGQPCLCCHVAPGQWLMMAPKPPALTITIAVRDGTTVRLAYDPERAAALPRRVRHHKFRAAAACTGVAIANQHGAAPQSFGDVLAWTGFLLVALVGCPEDWPADLRPRGIYPPAARQRAA